MTKDAIMEAVWADTYVTDDSLVQCISEIRKALGPEDGKRLKTIPKQGYRLDLEAGAAPARKPRPWRLVLALAAVIALAVGALFLWQRTTPGQLPVTLAVLPFTNLGANADQDYMSVGLAEDLLTDLAQVHDITVLSRTSTFGLERGPDTVRLLNERRGATHVIDGSLQRNGDRLRISVQLVDAATGASLWAERYDRSMGDIFAVQDEVRKRIFAALAVRLAPGEEARLKASRPQEVSAYDLFLQGRYQEAALSQIGVTQAADLYERVIAIDPGFAEAYARLANMYDFKARFHWTDDPGATRTKAIEMAETAVRLDPNLPYAHWALGRVLARLGTDTASFERAIAEFHAAIALDPNFADAYSFLSLVLIGDGQAEAATEAIDRAFRLNPEPPGWYDQNRGIVSYFRGDFEAAVEQFETAVRHNPTAAFGHIWLAAAYAMAGRTDDAEWEIDEAQSLGDPQSIAEVLTANSVIHHEPYRQVYAAGLRAAGLPE